MLSDRERGTVSARLEKKQITLPIVNDAVILGTNKVYEFHDWKFACGSTQMYNMINDGAAREFSYSL
jgi:hypothetical protein